MKSLLKMTLIGSAVVFALAGCDDKKENTTPESTVSQVVTTMETDAQKEAYALGSSFGNYLKNSLERSKVTMDSDLVVKGFDEALRGNSQYTQQETQIILSQFEQRLQKESQERLAKAKVESIEAGDKFRAEFAAQPDVKQTESGLLYQIVQEGTGEHPDIDDIVIVHYTGTLVDGAKFDSSYDRGETAKFPLNGVIKGWQEGIQLVGVGGKIKLVVPPELAYGDMEKPAYGEDSVGIPPASTLVFEVELLGIDGSNTFAE